MNAEEFRGIAVALPGVVEGEHMGHPDFRVGGKIFATLAEGGELAMVKLTPELQKRLVEDAAFFPCKGAWGKAGATHIRLAEAGKRQARSALLAAHANVTGDPHPIGGKKR